jgi:hypothetical protein
MATTFVLSQYHLASHCAYREQVLGMKVRYVTSAGSVVEGVLSEHPISPGGLQLAVVCTDGTWAGVHSGERLEVVQP